MTLAVRELDDPRAGEALAKWNPEHDAKVTRWLGTAQRSIVVRRVYTADPERAWEAVSRALEDARVGFTFAETVGPPLLEGGYAVFKMPSLWQELKRTGHHTAACYHCETLELRVLRASIRRIDERHCEVTLTADLRPGAHTSLKWARGGAAVGGTIGAGIGVSMALGTFAASFLALAALPLVGLMVFALGWTTMYRALYPHAARKLELELIAVLDRASRDAEQRNILTGPHPRALKSSG